MRKTKDIRVIITILVIAGWVLPSVWPGYGIPFGQSGPKDPEYYHQYIYLGELGFLSRGIIIEDTWDGDIGHTWPKGSWLSGSALSIWFVISVLVCAWLPWLAFAIKGSWSIIRILLVSWAVCTFYPPGRFPFNIVIFISVYAGIAAAAFIAAKRTDAWSYDRRYRFSAALSISFYPIWILTLALTFSTMPFIGIACYSVACGLLIVAAVNTDDTKAENHSSCSEDGDRRPLRVIGRKEPIAICVLIVLYSSFFFISSHWYHWTESTSVLSIPESKAYDQIHTIWHYSQNSVLRCKKHKALFQANGPATLYEFWVILKSSDDFCDDMIPDEVAEADYFREDRAPYYGYFFSLSRDGDKWAVLAFPEKYGKRRCRKTFAATSQYTKMLKYIKEPGPLTELPDNYEQEGWQWAP